MMREIYYDMQTPSYSLQISIQRSGMKKFNNHPTDIRTTKVRPLSKNILW